MASPELSSGAKSGLKLEIAAAPSSQIGHHRPNISAVAISLHASSNGDLLRMMAQGTSFALFQPV